MSTITIANYRSKNLIADHRFYDSAANFPPHLHDAYELLFLTKGDATYTVEGKAYRLTKGSLIITRPLKVHSITVHAPSEYERYDILFDSSLVSPAVCSLIPAKLDVLQLTGTPMLPDVFKKVDYYCGHLTGDLLHTALTRLIEEALIHIFILSQQTRDRSSYITNPLVNQAIKYIELHLTQQLTVDAVCKELHISQSYLLYLFGKHLNISPKKYIMSKRLAMAQMALRSGEKPMDIYRECGFSDYSTFFRAYRNHFGHAPTKEPDLCAVLTINS